MRRLTPTPEQLKRIDDFRAVAEGVESHERPRGKLSKLAKLLGLPKPEPEPEEVPWKSFHHDKTLDDDDFRDPVEGVDVIITPLPVQYDADGNIEYNHDPEIEYSDGDDDGIRCIRRHFTEDYIRERDQYWARQREEYDAAEKQCAEAAAAHKAKRDAADEAIKQWAADNAALLTAMQDWSDYFWRIANPKLAARRDAQDRHAENEQIFETLRSMKRHLKKGAVVSTVADLIADAFSEWRDLGDEARQNEESQEEHFPTKAEQWAECADTMEGLSEPDVPERLGNMTVAYFVEKYGTGRDARNTRACDDAQLAIDHLQTLEGDEEAAALASAVEEAVSEAQNVSFPGWGG